MCIPVPFGNNNSTWRTAALRTTCHLARRSLYSAVARAQLQSVKLGHSWHVDERRRRRVNADFWWEFWTKDVLKTLILRILYKILYNSLINYVSTGTQKLINFCIWVTRIPLYFKVWWTSWRHTAYIIYYKWKAENHSINIKYKTNLHRNGHELDKSLICVTYNENV